MTQQTSGKRINKYGVFENVQLTAQEWAYRWSNNHIGFHRSFVDKDLIKYESLFLKKKCKVYVPLCGKSLDLVYLADKGYDVYGCEFVEKAVLDFFSENSLSYVVSEKKTTLGCINEYTCTTKQLTIYQGDYFVLTKNIIGKFDAIWDRASLIAIDPSKRLQYVDLMKDLMVPGGKCLLSTLFVSGEKYYGPPHSVSPDDVNNLYDKVFHMQLIDTKKEPLQFPNAVSVHKSLHLLTLKTA